MIYPKHLVLANIYPNNPDLAKTDVVYSKHVDLAKVDVVHPKHHDLAI